MLFRRRPSAYRRPPPRPSLVGAGAPPVSGPGPDVAPQVVEVATGRHLLAFLSGGCVSCRQFWSGLGERRPEVGAASVAIVTPDPATDPRRGVARLAPEGVTVVMSTPAWLAYRAAGAPWFCLVVDGTVVAEGPAASWAQLGALTAATGGRPAGPGPRTAPG